MVLSSVTIDEVKKTEEEGGGAYVEVDLIVVEGV